ncbi:MAG: creatininase family protein, partial [Betaproteobacteria bacterium]|nr:creatininase family protein [Betaproteobacteria bacterium]
MHTYSRLWADWTSLKFDQARAAGTLDRLIAVLPVAATEQHGPHLPLQVDSALVEGVIAHAMPHIPPEVPALFLPTQAVGFSP